MPLKGFKHSPEALKKMSDAKKGKVPTHLVKYWTGRKQTEEHRQKSIKTLTHRYQKGMIAPMKGKKNLGTTGSNHWDWKGGVTKNPRYISWQKNLHNKRKRANGGSHSYQEWEKMKEVYHFTCPMCLRKEPEITLTEDHIIPVSKGGTDDVSNIQPLCKICNLKKHAKLITKLQIPTV